MKSYILFILLLIPLALPAQDVEFKATGPNSVEEGRRFQLIYRVNKAGNNLLLPELDNFNVLMGPTTSQRSQVQIINGKVSREEEYTYTYILKAKHWELSPFLPPLLR